jgi:acetoin utilization deacetylase AcuC-like enzyme
VRSVISGDAAQAFALGRPPGHHAERAAGMGFCQFNNIAVAAAHAIADHGVERVLIVDWDVHHGNGTQHIFEDRADVLVFNAHQHPLYPGTGAIDETGRGPGADCTVNAPLPAGSDDATYIALFRELLLPIADAYEPQLILVSAGFDAHERDPLGGMRVTTSGFATLCRMVADLAERQSDGRLALVLEGGYDLDGLAEGVRACVDVLSGKAPDAEAEVAEVPAIVQEICAFHSHRWPAVARG